MFALLVDLLGALALGMSMTCAIGALSSSSELAEPTAAHGRFSELRTARNR
jgi:hypothetical protein